MTKKHFIALANTVMESKPVDNSGPDTSDYTKGMELGRKMQWEFMRERLAEFCKSQNSNFMMDRWVDYINGECGPNGGKVK